MIEGLSHITFIVQDLDRASSFLQGVFDAKETYSSGNKTFSHSREKFFLISDMWIALMEGDSLQEQTYNHVAFKIAEEEFEKYEARVRAAGVAFKPPRDRVAGEGRSLYFYDFDNHLFELHTGTLEDRLASYSEIKTR